MYGLISILEKEYSISEVIEMLSNIDVEELKDYAIGHNICPKCFGELSEYRYQENRGEAWGRPAYETMCELRCEGCGEVYE